MSHFYERMMEKRIDILKEVEKIDALFNEEFGFYNHAYFTPFCDYLDETFRKLPIAYNNLSCKTIFTELKEERMPLKEFFINYCEFSATLLSQFIESRTISPHDFNTVKNHIISILKLIDWDLEKLSLTRKTIESKLGKVTVIVPKDILLEEALSIANDKDVQDSLIVYKSTKLEGNVKEKEKILILLANYIEGITKNNELKIKNLRLFDDINFLLNNFEIRHNNSEVNIKKYYEATLDEREEWLDLIYSEILFVICSKKENENHLKIEELKQRV